MTFQRAVYQPGDFPRDQRPQFAMVGRSNVGKSSLINAVLNRKSIARVSQTPGKTQAIQFYLVNDKFYIVDLPGYGYAKVPKSVSRTWGDLIKSYFEEADELQRVFLLLDVRRDPSDQDLRMHEWSRGLGREDSVILTKADKLSKNQLVKRRAEIAKEMNLDPKEVIPFSAVTKEGVDQIRREIASRL